MMRNIISDTAPQRPSRGELLLGEDWVSPVEAGLGLRVKKRGRLNSSPLARKIIIFNLVALLIMVVGVLFLNPFRASLEWQQQAHLQTEAKLLSKVLEATSDTANLDQRLTNLDLDFGMHAVVLDASGEVLGQITGQNQFGSLTFGAHQSLIGGGLDRLWQMFSWVYPHERDAISPINYEVLAQKIFQRSQLAQPDLLTQNDKGKVFSAFAPLALGEMKGGALVLFGTSLEIDDLVRYERELVLQVFIIALVVSVILSLILASTIASPLQDLAAAVEIGREGEGSYLSASRVHIPDLAARPDEIGRLSVAMRGMVAALYDRIDSNEQFAADVSHEIKNPLASLRSAVGSLRIVKKDEHRDKLLDVIEHDVRRLDRLLSDISNASRLDSELVKEEEQFDLLRTLTNLTGFLAQQAAEKNVDFITDLPNQSIIINGLEERMAQVFVNLITNAISFCDAGDAVRVWARHHENRVLVVVEDTGPGIPEQALSKVFKRFYSDRPPTHFGNNSGLGLAISKQIVEAHGGVIWAENIRSVQSGEDGPVLGARFVVGLPI